MKEIQNTHLMRCDKGLDTEDEEEEIVSGNS